MRSFATALLATLFIISPAQAQSLADMVDFSGYIESDTRVILDDYRGLKPGGKLSARRCDHQGGAGHRRPGDSSRIRFSGGKPGIRGRG